MPKHMTDEFVWMPKVELVSARGDINIECLWNTASEFKKQIGVNYLKRRRAEQTKKGMWKFLGEALMKKLTTEYEEG